MSDWSSDVCSSALGEPTADLVGGAVDGFLDDRCAQDLVVQHDCEGAADVAFGDRGELVRADGVEAEGDDRLAGALVEGRLCVDQALAADGYVRLNRIARRAVGCGEQNDGGDRTSKRLQSSH